MGRFRSHIPLEPPSKETLDFDGHQGLLALPPVSLWTLNRRFHRFSRRGNALMAELDGGRVWWVVGYVSEMPAEIPDWDLGIYQIKSDDGSLVEVSGRDVEWSCGDQIRLKSGLTVRRWAD